MRKEHFYEIWRTWNELLEDCTQVLMTIEWSRNANGRQSCSLAEINFFLCLSIDNCVSVCRVEIRWSVEISRESGKYDWPEIITHAADRLSFHKCKWPKVRLNSHVIANWDVWRSRHGIRKEEEERAERMNYVWTRKKIEWAERRHVKDCQVNNRYGWSHL